MATLFSLAITPDIAVACTYMAPIEISSNHMREKCRAAMGNQRHFLKKVKAEKLDEGELADYVRAFDDGKYGCRENNAFVFRILDSFYSVAERKYSHPSLLQRYAYNWPDKYEPERLETIYNVIWLFSERHKYLPYGLNEEKAREFVARPEHWEIALQRFGNSPSRDDAVFANVSDPKSPHFDRDLAVRLSGYRSESQLKRRVTAAALFIDPAVGDTDYTKAETLLPVFSLYDSTGINPDTETARGIWRKIADHYERSGDASLREKGQLIREKMSPPTLAKWPTIEHPKDGRVWLSLADWPKSVPNPFGVPKYSTIISVHDYPPRALRTEETGAVTIAARFGTDGRFSGLEVIRSSGSALLDEATVRIVQRRHRPKLDDMGISGYAGKEVRVPLLVVDWQLADSVINSEGGLSRYEDGRLTIIAQPRIIELSDGGCGPPPSIFL